MGTAFNLIGYQFVWFAAVLGAARGSVWWGIFAAGLFGALHLATSMRRSDDARLSASSVAFGVAMDGGLSLLGLVQYQATMSPWPPIWLLAIWSAFGLTLHHSFALSQRHLGITAMVGAVGGPLAYLAAERLHALNLPQPAWRGVVALAVAWSIALPSLAAFARTQRRALHGDIRGVGA